jgi:hypothetical protein
MDFSFAWTRTTSEYRSLRRETSSCYEFVLSLRALPTRQDGSPRDLSSPLRSKRLGPGGPAPHAAQPSERHRMRILGNEPIADDSNPLRRRAATRAGRSDIVRDGRLDELLLHIADETPPTHEP